MDVVVSPIELYLERGSNDVEMIAVALPCCNCISPSVDIVADDDGDEKGDEDEDDEEEEGDLECAKYDCMDALLSYHCNLHCHSTQHIVVIPYH